MHRIVVIDECKDDLASSARLLASVGCLPTKILGYNDAVKRAAVAEPDLILVDIAHPGGLELLRSLARDSNTCHIPIVVTTVEGHLDSKVRALWVGARDLLVKPLAAAQVAQTIRGLVPPSVEEPAIRYGTR